MTPQELGKLLGKVDDDAKIIFVVDKNQIPPILLKNAETATIGGKVYKYIRNGLGVIVSVWIFMLTMFPEITPTPLQAYKIVNENGPAIMASIDFSFPFSLPNSERPWVLFPDTLPNGDKSEGSNYFIAASGISPKLF